MTSPKIHRTQILGEINDGTPIHPIFIHLAQIPGQTQMPGQMQTEGR